MNNDELKKEIKKVEPFVDFYGQIPTLTKDNTKEFIKYIKLKAQLKGRQEAQAEMMAKVEDFLDLVGKDKKLLYTDKIRIGIMANIIFKDSSEVEE